MNTIEKIEQLKEYNKIVEDSYSNFKFKMQQEHVVDSNEVMFFMQNVSTSLRQIEEILNSLCESVESK